MAKLLSLGLRFGHVETPVCLSLHQAWNFRVLEGSRLEPELVLPLYSVLSPSQISLLLKYLL